MIVGPASWPMDVRLGALLLLVLLPGLWLFRGRAPSRARRVLRRVHVLVCATLAALAATETVFHHAVGMSDGFGITLAHQNWKRWSWGPEQFNSLNYRDREPSPANYAGKKVLIVVGDSLVQGHGVARAEDIFPSVIRRGLPDGWDVAAVAKEAWETPDQAQALRAFPLRPDAVVLSYFPNDITKIAIRGHVEGHRDWLPKAPTGVLGRIVAESYVANFVYWRIARGAGLGDSYLRFLGNAFRDEKVWEFHQRELQSIVDYARENEAPLLVMVTPFLQAIEESAEMTEKVVGFFRERGVPVVDMVPVLRGRDPVALVVNRFDAHPGVDLHREMGEILVDRLRVEGIVR